MASLGFDVLGVDTDPSKVGQLVPARGSSLWSPEFLRRGMAVTDPARWRDGGWNYRALRAARYPADLGTSRREGKASYVELLSSQ
jgi:hypothetical protein